MPKETHNKLKLSVVVLMVAMMGLALVGCGGAKGKDVGGQVELKILSGWAPGQGNPGVEMRLIPLVDKLNEKGQGRLKVVWRGPEAVPPFEQLAAVKNGSFDMVFTNGAYHSGDTVAGTAMDLIVGSAKELRDKGLYDLMDEIYQKKANSRVLSLMGVGSGYQFLLRNKIEGAKFSGLKIRATTFYAPLVESLGGVVVNMPVPEVYSNLEKGVVDGAGYMAIGVTQLKLNEVTKYLLRPTFGEGRQMLLVNKDKWAKLPEDLKKLINDTIKEQEDTTRDTLRNEYLKEEKEMQRLGMQLLELPPAEADKYLKTFYESSINNLIIKQEPEYGPKIKKLTDQFKYGW